jgi:tRNA1(Val) A37 N6-methylase TrmN6
MLRIFSGGRAANFRPTVSRTVIHHLSNPGETLLDFSAGFGGRLLGALTLKRHYVGLDPAKQQAVGLHKMLRALDGLVSGTAEIYCERAEAVMPTLREGSIDLVFSSPPYFDVEKYSQETTQSYIRYPTYDVWRHRFLQGVVQESYRILRAGGRLAINVANHRRYRLATDVLEFAEPLFGAPQIFRMAMNASPQRRANGERTYRWEPILVFRRGA